MLLFSASLAHSVFFAYDCLHLSLLLFSYLYGLILHSLMHHLIGLLCAGLVVAVEDGTDVLRDRDLHEVVGLRDQTQRVGPVLYTLQTVHSQRILPHNLPDLIVFAFV
jgi:hypothetical protein